VDQWADEVKLFNIDPIIGHSGISGWETRLSREVMKFKQHRSNFFCLILTNNSFKLDRIQKLILENVDETLLLVDEAHNFGAFQLSEYLNERFRY
jgi:superfamily II DNA or RNA helicase